MGGKSSPIASIVKAVENTAETVGKGFKDTVDTGIKTANDLGADDFVKANSDLFNEVKDKATGGSIILSPTNAQEEAAKDAAKEDDAQRAQALRDQNEAQSNLRKQNAANANATRGSSIILGKKGKKGKRGGTVSSGLGLSKGKTGLQT